LDTEGSRRALSTRRGKRSSTTLAFAVNALAQNACPNRFEF